MSDSPVMDAASKVLVDLISKVSDGASSAADFLKDNIPDVLREYLLWGAISNGACLVLASATIVFFVWSLTRRWEWYVDGYDDASPLILAPLFIGGGAIVVWLISLFSFLKIVFVPKLYLLEQASSLLHR